MALFKTSLCLLLWIQSNLGNRIKSNIYNDLQESAFCFRRTNGTHQMGCTGNQNGNVGVVHLITNDQDTSWLIDQGPHAPYIALLTPKMYKKDALLSLKSSGKINGVIVLGVNDSLPNLETPRQQSDDQACPNRQSSLYQDCPDWNQGSSSGIMLEDWPFPIFYIDNEKSVESLLHDCFGAFNEPSEDGKARSWPLCAVELKSHMYSSQDTKTCIRRNDLYNPFSPILICDPMGDQNVFHLSGKNVDFGLERFGNDSVLLISTRLDAANIFDKLEVGFDSPSMGIVTLLATAELIYRSKNPAPFLKPGQNVLFAFLNGESFDYIGSSRMIWDMKNGKFPGEKMTTDDDSAENQVQWPLIDLESIKAHIELGQLVDHEKTGRIYAHVDSGFQDPDLLQSLIQSGSESDLDIKASSGAQLPPCSIQSLLKEKRSKPGIFLSNFDEKYSNPFYHSLFDTAKNNDFDGEESNGQLVDHLAKIVETLARTIHAISGEQSGRISGQDFKADKKLIDDLIQCYTVSYKCDKFKEVANAEFLASSKVLSQYVGVDRSYNQLTIFTQRLLAYLTTDGLLSEEYRAENCTAPENQTVYRYYFVNGDKVPSWYNGSKEECDKDETCGFCMNTTAFLTKAVSPGK